MWVTNNFQENIYIKSKLIKYKDFCVCLCNPQFITLVVMKSIALIILYELDKIDMKMKMRNLDPNFYSSHFKERFNGKMEKNEIFSV